MWFNGIATLDGITTLLYRQRGLNAEVSIIGAHQLCHLVTLLPPEAERVPKHHAQTGPRKAGEGVQTGGSSLGEASAKLNQRQASAEPQRSCLPGEQSETPSHGSTARDGQGFITRAPGVGHP